GGEILPTAADCDAGGLKRHQQAQRIQLGLVRLGTVARRVRQAPHEPLAAVAPGPDMAGAVAEAVPRERRMLITSTAPAANGGVPQCLLTRAWVHGNLQSRS